MNEYDLKKSEAIFNYICNTFDVGDNSFVRTTFQNVIDYGVANCSYGRNQLAYYLSDVFEGLEFEEIRDVISEINFDINKNEEKEVEL